MLLSDVCLSVTDIVPNSNRERPRKTKIGTEVAHVRPLYSPPCWRVRQLQQWAWERVSSGKLLLRCRLLGGAWCFSAHWEERGGAYRVSAASLLLVFCWTTLYINSCILTVFAVQMTHQHSNHQT